MQKHIITLNEGSWNRDDKHTACGECQTSCQSACKTSCTVGNQACLKEKKWEVRSENLDEVDGE